MDWPVLLCVYCLDAADVDVKLILNQCLKRFSPNRAHYFYTLTKSIIILQRHFLIYIYSRSASLDKLI